MEMVERFFEEGGPVMFAIAIASIAAWALIFRKWLELRWSPDWADEVLTAARESDWERAERITQSRADPLALVLKTGLEARSTSRDAYRAIVTRTLKAEQSRLSHSLRPLGALAALLPLLGLLGTVLGMVATFGVIQWYGTGDPRLMATGIRQALLTTQAGLLAAVPVLLLLRYLASRGKWLGGEMELHAHQLEVTLFGAE
jgi:biopolymer transport protein ExbB